MSKKKINVWGSKLPYTTVKLNSGSIPGTTNYNDLTNKPRINGQELIGNTDLNNTYYTKQEINNSFYTKSNMSTLYYNKDAVDSMISGLTERIDTLQDYIDQKLTDDFYSKTDIDNKIIVINNNINSKTNKEAIYTQNKAIIKQGEYIQLTKDDANKTITIAQSLRPDPEAPITGVVFKDDTVNDYVILNQNDIFDPTAQTINGTYAHLEGSVTYQKTEFNPLNPIIVNSDVLNQAKTNGSLSFFNRCTTLNTPIDLSQTTKANGWDDTGLNFLLGCTNFNSTIRFNGLIEKISYNFMYGCSKFNNLLIDLFTPNLKLISKNFMEFCAELAQDFDFSNTGLTTGKINLVNFMYQCYKMGGHTINLGNAGLDDIFKKTNYTTGEFSDIDKCFATLNGSSSLATTGINLISSNATAAQAHDWEATDENQNTYKPLQSSTESLFKKIFVNGVEVQ